MDTDETAERPCLLSQLLTFRSVGPLRKDDPSYQALKDQSRQHEQQCKVSEVCADSRRGSKENLTMK